MRPRNSSNQDDDHIDDQWDAVVAAAASLGGYFDTTRLTDDSNVSEEPGNGSPAQTSSTTSESYYPEVREKGEIPIRFFDTTNGQLPSFFYAPRDDLDLDWRLEPFDYLFRTELEQFESVLHHLHDLHHPQDFNHAPALFVRDNVAGVNLLYNGSPHIYRYNDTYQSWEFNDLDLENGGGKISLGFKNTSPIRNEVAHGPWPKAFTPTDVSQSCDAAKKTFRRVV
ncbi:hypothetical protein D6D19_01658 [Aureobasidium pullulans]|uniref:Uncharacterized protein n=1 Tax=Aureobasidium pullulans TaxID=5580 RepID=A0A4S9KKM5_AURPU|nr:hypothetical protein D6D19_01658 [Aureobasidium pullulans]THY16677.1 hypothetical protein D6D00_08784 [Aureobasidium pullulans]